MAFCEAAQCVATKRHEKINDWRQHAAPPRSNDSELTPPPMPTVMQVHQQAIQDLETTEGFVLLTSLTLKSTVLCTQAPAKEHHTNRS
jgi:hypothetical protein